MLPPFPQTPWHVSPAGASLPQAFHSGFWSCARLAGGRKVLKKPWCFPSEVPSSLAVVCLSVYLGVYVGGRVGGCWRNRLIKNKRAWQGGNWERNNYDGFLFGGGKKHQREKGLFCYCWKSNWVSWSTQVCSVPSSPDFLCSTWCSLIWQCFPPDLSTPGSPHHLGQFCPPKVGSWSPIHSLCYLVIMFLFPL